MRYGTLEQFHGGLISKGDMKLNICNLLKRLIIEVLFFVFFLVACIMIREKVLMLGLNSRWSMYFSIAHMLQMMNSGFRIEFRDHNSRIWWRSLGISKRSKWQINCGTIEFLVNPLEFYWANMWMGREYPIVWKLQSKVIF